MVTRGKPVGGGEHQYCGNRGKEVMDGFLEVVTLKLSLDERVGGSQGQKEGKDDLGKGNSFGSHRGIKTWCRQSVSYLYFHWEQNTDEGRR